MDPEYLSKGNLEVNKIQARIRSPQEVRPLLPGSFLICLTTILKPMGARGPRPLLPGNS